MEYDHFSLSYQEAKAIAKAAEKVAVDKSTMVEHAVVEMRAEIEIIASEKVEQSKAQGQMALAKVEVERVANGAVVDVGKENIDSPREQSESQREPCEGGVCTTDEKSAGDATLDQGGKDEAVPRKSVMSEEEKELRRRDLETKLRWAEEAVYNRKQILKGMPISQ